MTYAEFVRTKQIQDLPTGFTVGRESLNPMLFEFQRDIVIWALKRGRAGIFADCGLGKSPMQLEWAKHVSAKAGKPVLIFAPLAVSQQTKREGEKFGVGVTVCAESQDVQPGVNITNYEKLHRFPDPSMFGGVVLDESSILKGMDGKTRKLLTDYVKQIPYRLACTATPAPNDYMELGNHAEFLGVMNAVEMLAMFFTHDGADTSKWRIKGHAVDVFWKWVASWAVAIRKPSDLGYEDEGFTLPELRMHQITVKCDKIPEWMLFPVEGQSLSERNTARKDSIEDRVKACADIVNADKDEAFLVWCNLNAESEALKEAIPTSIEVSGSDSAAFKEAASLWFIGDICKCQLPKKTSASTCGNGPERTENESGNIEGENPKPGMRSVASNTPMTPPCKDVTKSTHQYGNATTQKADSLSALSPTESPLRSTENYSPHRMGSVPFAGDQNVLTSKLQSDPATERSDSTLTTAIPMVELEVCSAHHATLGSGNSRTTHQPLKKQPCICGVQQQSRVLVSKSKIFGFGLNFQHCHNVAFVGLSDSYEQFYQAIRRCWRFGQQRPVECYVITADTEGAVVRNIQRKEKQSQEMMEGMVRHMRSEMEKNIRGASREVTAYRPQLPMTIPAWLRSAS